MRSFVITLIVLVAVVAGALATAPWLIDWNDYRGALTRQAEAITGSAVTIEGRISFRLLPTPTLTLARTKLTSGSQAAGHMLLVIDRLDLQLRALPLLRGQVQVGDVRLVRPILQLDMAPDEALRLPPTGRHPILSLVAIEPDHLTVVDGHIRLQGEEAAWQLDEVALEAVAESPNGPFALDGGFTLDARPFELDAQIGQPGPDGAGSLQLELTADDAASLLFRGAVWWDRADPRLRGEVTLAGDNARSSIALVGDALRRAMPPMPPWLDQPFDIAANLRLDRSRLLLDELRLAVAGMEADGELDLALGPSPRIALGLRAQRLVLTDPLRAGPADLAFLTALPAALHGEIDLSVAALEYRGRATSRVRLRLMLTGDGEVAVEQASAILPGQTDVRFAGRVAGEGETVALQGDVSAVTDDLSALLAWLDIEPPGVAAGRLRTLSLASALVIDRDTVRFSQAELRVDATQLRGSLDLAIGAATAARPRIEAAVVLDRLNIDAYQADLRPADAARLLQRALQSVDAAIEARIERLTWRGLYMRDLAVALRAEDGRLVLSEGSIELAGEARALLQGQIDLGSGAFTWNGELHTARPGRLLRRLDLTTPLMLTRMSPLTVTATARGRSDAFDLEVEIDDGEGRLTATGDAGWVEGDPRYNLELELSHPDYGALFRALGARTPAPDAVAPLSVTGKVIRNAASEHTIVGSARIDAMTLTGLIAWQQGAERPSVEMQLSVGDPSQEILTGLLALAGVSPSPVRLDAPLLGNLPRDALPFGWLARFDGELRLSAKGGLAGKGIEMHARVQDRKLFVERCLVELDHGTADVELILDTDRPLPFLTAAIDLRRVDAAWLAGLLDLEPVIEGAADLTSELTAVGTSPYELVRSTIGRIELTIGDGRLIGDDIATIAQALSADNADPAFDPQVPVQELLPIEPGLAFSDLAGRFALDRGMARTGSTTLDLDGAEGRISGVIDLLLWVADLTLEVEPPASAPIELRIVGPLQEPQTRLVIPEALPQPRKRNGPLSWDRSSSRGAPARRTPRR